MRDMLWHSLFDFRLALSHCHVTMPGLNLGSFRGGTFGNGVPIVRVFKNAKKCTALQDFAHSISKFIPGVIPQTRASSTSVLGPKDKFPFGLLFYATTTGLNPLGNSGPLETLVKKAP